MPIAPFDLTKSYEYLENLQAMPEHLWRPQIEYDADRLTKAIENAGARNDKPALCDALDELSTITVAGSLMLMQGARAAREAMDAESKS